MSLILKNAVKQVDEKSKSYFVDKLKEYDYLIDEKEKKLRNKKNNSFFMVSEFIKLKNSDYENSCFLSKENRSFFFLL